MDSVGRRELLASMAVTVGATVITPTAAAAAPAATRSWTVGDQRGLASLTLGNRRLPAPGPGEALVRTTAAALNHRDLMILESRYGARKPATRVPLSDGAGVIIALGPDDGSPTPLAIGDRVTAAHFIDWHDGPFRPAVFARDLGNSADGWAAEYVLLPRCTLLRIPDELGDSAAAALGAAGITAWTVIETLGRVQPGDVVLTLGTGGVAILALQIAKMAGARVAITSSSDAKLAIARRLGADIVINYRTTPDWPTAVVAATGGRGADIVVETAGLGTLEQSVAACAPNARIGFLGALAAVPAEGTARPWPALIGKNLTLKGITSGSRAELEALLRAAAANGLDPHRDRSFPFDELPAAYAHLAGAQHVGKVTVSFP